MGYRGYDNTELKYLVFIQHARTFGFSIDECRELLGLYEDQKPSGANVKHLTNLRLKDIEKKQKELQFLHERPAHLIQNCKGDGRPNRPIL